LALEQEVKVFHGCKPKTIIIQCSGTNSLNSWHILARTTSHNSEYLSPR